MHAVSLCYVILSESHMLVHYSTPPPVITMAVDSSVEIAVELHVGVLECG